MRRLGALLCGAALALSLAGCGQTMTKFDAAAYVKGVLDETYKGQWNAVFLDLVDKTESQAKDAYAAALDQEYARFCYQFDIRDQYLKNDAKEDVMDFLKEICAQASYAVGKAVELDDERYAVEVNIRPMDLFLQVEEDALAEFAKEFQAGYEDVDVEKLNPRAQKQFWQKYESEWAQGVVKLCRSKLGTMTYLEVEPILVLVAPDKKGMYGMSDNDFTNLGTLILPY